MTGFYRLIFSLLVSGLLAGCGGSSSGTGDNSPADKLSLKMQLPDSLTGGPGASGNRTVTRRLAQYQRRGRVDASSASQGWRC